MSLLLILIHVLICVLICGHQSKSVTDACPHQHPHLWTPDSSFYSLPADTSATLQGASSLQSKTGATSLALGPMSYQVALWLSNMQMAIVYLAFNLRNPDIHICPFYWFCSLETPSIRGGCCVVHVWSKCLLDN